MKLLLNKSLAEQIPIEIIYLSERQQFTQRSIVVKQLDGEYIQAFCYLRRQTRRFKRKNILSMMPTKSDIRQNG